MGRAMRWLRGLLSDEGRKKKKPEGDRNARMVKGKKDWSFARSFRDKERRGGGVGAKVGGRRGAKEEKKGMVSARSFHAYPAAGDGDAVLNGRKKQNEGAIMVAAAAKAAFVAAQAVASVVMLTSKGGGAASLWSNEDLAAVKIQAVFRGYLARRALKALKGLVKLQALVRGHMVRKQAVETLRCLQALVRAQSRARAGREIRNNHPPNKGCRHYDHFPPTVANNDSKVCINCASAVRPASIGRNGTRARKIDAIDTNLLQSAGWNWQDQWMEDRYWDEREALSRTAIATCDERNEKILEVDAGRPYLNAKRRNNQQKMFSSRNDQNTRTCMTMLDSPSRDSTVAQYSVPSLSSVCKKEFLSPQRFTCEGEVLCESPQFCSVSSRTGSSVKGPFASAKSEGCRSHHSGCAEYPNYMSNTESSRAKSRSCSAPRQRPEFEKSASAKGSLYVRRKDGGSASTASQRSSLHLKFDGKASYPGSGSLDKMGLPTRNLWGNQLNRGVQ